MGSSTHWRHVGSPYDCYEIIKVDGGGVTYADCLDRFVDFRDGPEPDASWLAYNHSVGLVPKITKHAMERLRIRKKLDAMIAIVNASKQGSSTVAAH